MKKIALISSLVVLLALAFSFGHTAGAAAEINPIAVGFVAVIGACIAMNPKGSMASGIDVTQIVADLGKYLTVPKTATDIWRRLFSGLELSPYLRKIGGQTGKYVGMSSSTTEVMQPFQSGWTPKGTTTFTPFINDVFRSKVDFLIDNIDEIVGSWLIFLHDETKDRKDWPLVKYIVEFELIPRIIEEQNVAMCRGVYLAPTPGTAGDAIDTMNGLQTIITDQITATTITPIVTGSVSASTGVDRFETFADGIDSKYSDKGGVILCSKTLERYYKQDYRATFGSTNDPAAKNNTALDHYNIKIVGLEGWGTSQRMVFSQNGNLLHLYDKIFTPSTFQVQADKRDVILLADWHAAIGLNTLDGVFANDQA